MSQPSGGGQLPPASPQPGWVTLRAKRPRPLPRPPSLALAAPQRALPQRIAILPLGSSLGLSERAARLSGSLRFLWSPFGQIRKFPVFRLVN